jgi:hypothetical protein
MPLTFATFMGRGNTSNISTYVSPVWSPNKNVLILAWIVSSKASAPNALASITGNGLVWTQVTTQNAGSLNLVSVWRAMSQGTVPASGGASMWFPSAQTGCAYGFLQIAGVPLSNDGSSAIVQFAKNSFGTGVTTSTTTLSALAKPSNAVVCGLGIGYNANPTKETAYTAAATHPGYSTPASRLGVSWLDAADTEVTPSWSWTGACAPGAIALELVAYGTNRSLSRVWSGGVTYGVGQVKVLGTFFRTIAHGLTGAFGAYRYRVLARSLTLGYPGGPAVASDNFNRADSNDLGSPWTHNAGGGVRATFSIQGSRAYLRDSSGGGEQFAFWDTGSFNNDQYARATFGSAAGGAGVYIGLSVRGTNYTAGSSIGYDAYVNDAGAWYVGRILDQGWAQLAFSATTAPVPGDVIEFRCSGQTPNVDLVVLHNGGTMVACGDTAANAPVGGYPGISGYTNTTGELSLDSWEGGPSAGASSGGGAMAFSLSQVLITTAARTIALVRSSAGAVIRRGQYIRRNVLARPLAAVVKRLATFKKTVPVARSLLNRVSRTVIYLRTIAITRSLRSVVSRAVGLCAGYPCRRRGQVR